MITTNESLLERVQRLDAHEAWKEFYDNYWAAIIRYGRKLGLSQTQAEDVLQETMVDLMRILPKFEYDRSRGRFRNFLLTIVHRKAMGVFRRGLKNSNVPWDSASPMEIEEAKQSSLREDQMQLWRESIYEEALLEVSKCSDIDQRTWAVFEAYVVKKRPVSEVAEGFGMKPNAIYQIKNRLCQRIRRQLNWKNLD
ncbi:RNA polymerase sigma factor [Actomonas aquatica]|uniref:Sigma-70 family RNA polymerase sigma factor n=1 Tax=Actomonas aquatica TaxID=2866162 RepID=A0ABZ1C2Z2_9BACT|nr:sigma-70 family RNA polymerase sigma factor [Opitutus sp. WL0086]WRQ85732.1 sigma-70 family RNA polymerase sigma factor [Opitutus sp. WL0086]